MNSKSGKTQRIHHNYTKIYLLTAALCVVAAAVVALVVLNVVKFPAPSVETQSPAAETQNTPEDRQTQQPTEEDTPTEKPSEQPISGAIERLTLSDVDYKKLSPLSLIDLEHPFTGKLISGMVNVYADRGEKAYMLDLLNSSIELHRTALEKLVELNAALNTEYPTYKLLILSGYTNDLNTTACTAADKTQPNTDEHVSGYAFDCRYIVVTGVDETGKPKTAGVQLSDPSAAAQTSFLLKKAAELGFVQSKANVAGHTQNDLRHLRYVGTPHAQFMYENKLTLSDYLEYLSGFNFNKRLTVNLEDGSAYEIYCVKQTGDETAVNVPKDANYTVWSDNSVGFIVTVTVS